MLHRVMAHQEEQVWYEQIAYFKQRGKTCLLHLHDSRTVVTPLESEQGNVIGSVRIYIFIIYHGCCGNSHGIKVIYPNVYKKKL